MKSKIKAVLNAPFPYFLNDEKRNAILIIGICVFLALFMLTFHPHAAQNLQKTFLTISFVSFVLFPAIILTPRLYPVAFDSLSWTFGKHLIFTICILIVIEVVVTTGLYLLGYYPLLTFADALKRIYPDVISYGSIPIIMVTLLMRVQLLSENLQDAISANLELKKIHVLKEQGDEVKNNTILINSDTTETLELNIQDLLFVEASDNYSTFFWKKGNATEKKMLRMNLKSVETQLNNSFAIRCHRSFIVNAYVINAIAGNSNGYKISIAGSDFSIPVSRSKGKEVIDKIGQIRSIMELR